MNKFAAGFATAFTFMTALIYFCGGSAINEQARAIKAGVARYTVNPTTGETKFEYIKPTEDAL